MGGGGDAGVGVTGEESESGGGDEASEQTGSQEAHSTVHESGQNLGHTCTRL